jgi:hypothetical protein
VAVTAPRTARSSEQGFALILAILALMLLTSLGLALTSSVSTELQIATNYRWSQQAHYLAEAGLEAGRLVLGDVADWDAVLPAPRGTWTDTPPAHGAAPTPAASRNWELADCDRRAGVGLGVILDDTRAAPLLYAQVPAGPYQNATAFRGRLFDGSFTLWVRRDVVADAAGNLSDESGNQALILVAEGTAPRAPQLAGGVPVARAMRRLQVKLSRSDAGGACEAAQGQMGGRATGENFAACAGLKTALGADDTGVQ